MKTDKHLLYFIGVEFGETFSECFYICYDNTVRVGDLVVVPTYDGEERKAAVVSAVYCTSDDTPVPLEKVKCVIRKLLPDCGDVHVSENVNSALSATFVTPHLTRMLSPMNRNTISAVRKTSTRMIGRISPTILFWKMMKKMNIYMSQRLPKRRRRMKAWKKLV